MGICHSADPNNSHAQKSIYLSGNEILIWEYLDDINTSRWKPFNPTISHQIDVAYSSKAHKCQINDKISGQSLEIDFGLMLETNLVTGWQRKIRIQPHSHSNSQSKQPLQNNAHYPQQPISHIDNSSDLDYHQRASQILDRDRGDDYNPLLLEEAKSKQSYFASNQSKMSSKHSQRTHKWQWHSDSIGWKDYDNKLSHKIDEAYREGLRCYAFKIRSNNTRYEIDFDSLRQCNLDSNKYRNVRRRLIKNGHKKRRNDRKEEEEEEEDDDDEDEEEDDTESEEEEEEEEEDDNESHAQQLQQRHNNIADDERFVWEYFNDEQNLWHEYNDHICLKIETVYQSNASMARMKINGEEYEIRLNELPMNQLATKTGKLAKLRRVIKKQKQMPMAAASASAVKNGKYIWRYKQGFNVWTMYPSDINTKIETAFRGQLDRVQFSMFNQNYEVQFDYLRQVNLTTNEINEITRIDDTMKNRTRSMFNQPLQSSQAQQPGQSSSIFPNGANLASSVASKPKKMNQRSQTVDYSKHLQQGNENKLDALVQQQQKAMNFFKRRYSKQQSLMSNPANSQLFAHIQQQSNILPHENEYIWQYKNDNNLWSRYEPAISAQIERALLNGQETVEVTKDGQVCEIRISLNQECHFATNKIRAIQRVSVSPSQLNGNDIVKHDRSQSVIHKSYEQQGNNNDGILIQQPQQNINGYVASRSQSVFVGHHASQQTVQINDVVPMANNDAFDDEFEALSNNLDVLIDANSGDSNSKNVKNNGVSNGVLKEFDEEFENQQLVHDEVDEQGLSESDDDDKEEEKEEKATNVNTNGNVVEAERQSQESEEREFESSEESVEDEDDDDDEEDDEEEEEEEEEDDETDVDDERQRLKGSATPAVEEYGDDYEEYMKKFENLNDGNFGGDQ